MQYCTVLQYWSALLYCTVDAIPYSNIIYSALPYSILLYSTLLLARRLAVVRTVHVSCGGARWAQPSGRRPPATRAAAVQSGAFEKSAERRSDLCECGQAEPSWPIFVLQGVPLPFTLGVTLDLQGLLFALYSKGYLCALRSVHKVRMQSILHRLGLKRILDANGWKS